MLLHIISDLQGNIINTNGISGKAANKLQFFLLLMRRIKHFASLLMFGVIQGTGCFKKFDII